MPGPFVGNPLAGHFGLFQTALGDPVVRAQPGGVQQYVWQALNNEYLARGESLPAGSFQAVNQLLSLAGQQRRASLELASSIALAQRTGLDQAVVVTHTAPALDARALNDMTLGPQHRLVYISSDIVEGEPVLSYKTHDFGYDLPQSVSALADAAEAAAQVESADYGFEWGGVATPVALLSY